MKNEVKKRFPASVQKDVLTFLNDKKVDAELYALLVQYSYPEQIEGVWKTVARKSILPSKKDMCETLGIKQTKTLNNHLNYLIERGYVEDLGKGDYAFPEVENQYEMLPLDTIQFFNDVIKDWVYKVFIYLGTRWNYKKGYVFTIEELAEHTGMKIDGDTRSREKINNALRLLVMLKLISYVEFYED